MKHNKKHVGAIAFALAIASASSAYAFDIDPTVTVTVDGKDVIDGILRVPDVLMTFFERLVGLFRS